MANKLTKETLEEAEKLVVLLKDDHEGLATSGWSRQAWLGEAWTGIDRHGVAGEARHSLAGRVRV